MNTIETLDPSPFKHLIMTIGELPSSFVESMSYYEMVAWLVDYIQKNVVTAVNNNALAIEEIQEWISTLDLQDEVDNKLEEMAASGELAEIIAQYLNSQAILCFDNVADMKNSDNLVDGSYAKTLGYHEINDGGGSLYKVRTVTNEDNVDEGYLVSLNNNTLVAELIYDTSVVPEQFGAYGDGEHDDIHALNICRDFCIDKKVVMSGCNKSVYGIRSSFYISEGFTLDFNLATIKALNEMQCVVEQHKAGSTPVLNETTENMVIDCNELADYGFYQSGFGWSTKVDNIRVLNPLVIGIYIKIGQIRLMNAKIEQQNNEISSIGLQVDSTDSEFFNIVIRNFTTGVKINAAGNSFNECHPVIFGGIIEDSVGWDIYASTKLVNCVSDSFMYGVKINGAYRPVDLINFQYECNTDWYNVDTASQAPYVIYFTEDQFNWTNQMSIVGIMMPVHAVWGSDYPKFTNISKWNGASLARNNPILNISYFINSIPNEINPYESMFDLRTNLNSTVSATTFGITRNGNNCYLRAYLLELPAVTAENTLNIIPTASAISISSIIPSLAVVQNVITSNGVSCRLRITTSGTIELYPYSNITAGDQLNLHLGYIK